MGNKDKPKDELLSFDWNCLPFWSDYAIAQDNVGKWWSYGEKPKSRNGVWSYIPEKTRPIPPRFAPTDYKGDWKDSLRINPKYKNKEVSK